MGTKKEEKEPSKNDLARLCDLLSRLPVDGFVGMVSNSGLPRKEARELCDAFRQMKK
jgi:hypothetical protein